MPILYLPHDWINRLTMAMQNPEQAKRAMAGLNNAQLEGMRYLYRNERDKARCRIQQATELSE